MGLQARKSNIINLISKIENEKLFTQIENLILDNINKPFSEKEFINRANKSYNDYLENKIINHLDLEKISKKW